MFQRTAASSLTGKRPANGGFIVGGENYGQGSSREHAALIPLFLGVRAVAAKSYARIHRRNLINVGIVPLVLAPGQGDIVEGARWEIPGLLDAIESGAGTVQSTTSEGATVGLL